MVNRRQTSRILPALPIHRCDFQQQVRSIRRKLDGSLQIGKCPIGQVHFLETAASQRPGARQSRVESNRPFGVGLGGFAASDRKVHFACSHGQGRICRLKPNGLDDLHNRIVAGAATPERFGHISAGRSIIRRCRE